MPGGLKLYANYKMILCVNISNYLKCTFMYIMTFIVAHWDTLRRWFHFSMQGEDIMFVLMASVMCLHFSMQEEYILEHALRTIYSTCRHIL